MALHLTGNTINKSLKVAIKNILKTKKYHIKSDSHDLFDSTSTHNKDSSPYNAVDGMNKRSFREDNVA